MKRTITVLAIATVFIPMAGCKEDPVERQIVVYCSVDETYAKPILDSFRRTSGITLSVVYDTEAGKTTGLVSRIIAEGQGGSARADLFWSGEVFNTIWLARQGLLAPYQSSFAGDIPVAFRDPHHRWAGTALRARVVAFDPERTTQEQVPARWEEFASPEHARRTAIANPLFGTTRGHAAAMFAMWGPQRGEAFLKALRNGGAQVLDGNSATVRALHEGRVEFAWTDSDDVFAAQRAGWSIDSIAPDMGDGGTLLIPCTVATLRGGPNADGAKKLYDYLVSAAVERSLAESESKNIPVREILRKDLGMSLPPASRVTYDAVADSLDAAVAAVREILLR